MATRVYSKASELTQKAFQATGVVLTSMVRTVDGDYRAVSAEPLSAGDAALLDAFMLDRGYEASVKTIRFQANSKIILDEKLILTTDWVMLGGVVSSPQFFVPELARCLGQILCDAKATGSGAKLRLVEENDAGDQIVVIPETDIAPVDGAYHLQELNSNVAPREVRMRYLFQGKLNSLIATTASIRFGELSLIELL